MATQLSEYLLCLFDGYEQQTIEHTEILNEPITVVQFSNRNFFDMFVDSIPKGEMSGGKLISIEDDVIDIGHSDMIVHLEGHLE